MAHLKSVPGGVLTLKLPPVESADPVDIARQIREMLTGAPASAQPSSTSFGAASSASADPSSTSFGGASLSEPVPDPTSPHLLAAATAAINWIHTRRAQWIDERPAELSPEPVAQSSGAFPGEPYEPHEPYEPYEPLELSESDHPYATNTTPNPPTRRASYATTTTQIKTWLPRAAALAVVIGIAGALVSYWPRIRGAFGSSVEQFTAPSANAPLEVAPPTGAVPGPVVPQPAAPPEPEPIAKVPGWVAVFSPIEVQISEANQGVQVDDRGRGMLPPGRHRLRFQNLELGYDETRTVEIRPTETTTINLTPQTTIGVTANEPAEVLIDGTRVGDTPYEGRVGLGTHTVTVKTPAGAERQLTVEATSKPVQLQVDFSQP